MVCVKSVPVLVPLLHTVLQTRGNAYYSYAWYFSVSMSALEWHMTHKHPVPLQNKNICHFHHHLFILLFMHTPL